MKRAANEAGGGAAAAAGGGGVVVVVFCGFIAAAPCFLDLQGLTLPKQAVV